jgi:hypothetical protein
VGICEAMRYRGGRRLWPSRLERSRIDDPNLCRCRSLKDGQCTVVMAPRGAAAFLIARLGVWPVSRFVQYWTANLEAERDTSDSYLLVLQGVTCLSCHTVCAAKQSAVASNSKILAGNPTCT